MPWPPLRAELQGLEPYGAPQLDVPVQLNVNENPYGPSPECVADIAGAVAEAATTLNRYPDREFVELRTGLAAYLSKDTPHGIVPDQVWADAARHYDERALAALVIQIALINAFNRINIPTRQVAGAWK